MKVLRGIWRLLGVRERLCLGGLQLLSVLMALSTVGGMAAVLPFFTVLTEPHAILIHPGLRFVYEHLHFTNDGRFAIALGVVFAAGVVLSNVTNLLGTLAIDRFAFRVGDMLQTGLFDQYLRRSYEFHSRTNSATLTSNVLHETGRVAIGILRHGLILVASSITAVCIVVSVVLFDDRVAIFAIAGLGVSYAAVYASVRAHLRRNGEIESENFAERTRIVGEGFGAIKEVIVLQAQPLFVANLERCGRSISKTIVSSLAMAYCPRHLLECATTCVLVGVALYSYVGGASVGPLVAQLSFVGLAIYRLLPVLQQGFLAMVRIRADSPAFERIAVDLQFSRAEIPVTEPIAPRRSSRGGPSRDIRLNAVSFAHSGGAAAALSNLTLHIPAGAIVGLIGANGSGKTTLLDVIGGLLVPQSGNLEIGGTVVDDANRCAWQSGIAYVPQHVFLCDSTVAENIALGTPIEQIDGDRLRMATRQAKLEDYIASLPDGYGERLGERGARLSGGLRQRMGIARALYRDASLLMMDEATSALDLAAEHEITEMLARHREGRTIVLVAHRSSALRYCDVIHELAQGHIVRSGTCRDLSMYMDEGAAAHRRRLSAR